jgi:capsular polysaccharide biosynthesis protein
MDLLLLARVLRRRWRLMTLCCLLGLLAGAGWAATRSEYVSSASILITAGNADSKQQLLTQPERYVRTQVKVLEGDPVLSFAAASLGHAYSVEQLKGAVQIDGGSVDDTIDVVAHASTAREARAVAESVSRAYLTAVPGGARILEVSAPARAMSLPRLLALGLAAGGIVGGVLALGLATIRRRVDGPHSIAEELPEAVVYPSTVRLRDAGRGRDGGGSEGEVPADLRRLAAWLLRDERAPRRLLVASLGRPDVSEHLATGLCLSLRLLGVASAVGSGPELRLPATARVGAHAVAKAEPDTGGGDLVESQEDVQMAITYGEPLSDGAGSNVLALAADTVLLLVREGAALLSDVAAVEASLTGRSTRVVVAVVSV